jgi:cell division protein FtsL
MRTETQQIQALDHEIGQVERRPRVRPDRAPESRQRVSNPVLFLIVAATIAVVGLLYLIQTSQVAGLGYEVGRLETERLEKSRENQQLTYEVAGYEALPKIELAARGQLGMEPIDSNIFLSVPRPANDELIVPAPETPRQRSLGERIWDRLTGEAEASHPAGDAP